MDFGIVFLAGLTLGGLSCSLIQIGLFSSGVTIHSSSRKLYWDISSFLITRVVVAMLLGLGLGFLGTSFLIPDAIKLFFQLLAGIIMVFTALSFVNVTFTTFGFSLVWKKISEVVFKIINSHSLFSPILLGIISLFIPCGAMLAVESAALVTGSPFQSALLLGVFVIGTIPAFLGIGLLSTIFRSKFQKSFYVLLGAFLLVFGILTINGVLVLANAPITLQKIYAYSPIQLNEENEIALSGVIKAEGKREVVIDIYPEGYTPDVISVGKGETVHLILKTHGVYNCSSMFKIPAKDISQQLPPDGTTVVTFVADDMGTMQFSCATGLKTGTIQVI